LDGENILSWNFANWLTVLLMAATGFAIFGFIGRLCHARKANANDPATATTV
jgi:hypothetical protein